MPIESRYLHMFVIKTLTATGSSDDYGQPVTAATTVATVPGLLQPRRGLEATYTTQAGPVAADWYGYMAPLATLTTACWIEESGVRYDVLNIKPEMNHHLELDLRRVG